MLAYCHTQAESKPLFGGGYLIRTHAVHYYVKCLFGAIYLYHKKEGFVAACRTQRELRNAIRAYTTNKTKTTLGRE